MTDNPEKVLIKGKRMALFTEVHPMIRLVTTVYSAKRSFPSVLKLSKYRLCVNFVSEIREKNFKSIFLSACLQ